MARRLVAAVLLAFPSLGSGQFLARSWSAGFSFSSSGPRSSHVQSFTTASSWSRDDDGIVHHDTRKTQTEVLKDGRGTQRVESKTICADGLCEQAAMKSVQAAMPRPRLPRGIHALMSQMLDDRVRVVAVAPQPPAMADNRVRVVAVAPQPQPMYAHSEPAVVVQLIPLRPSLRGTPIIINDSKPPHPPAPLASGSPSPLADFPLMVFLPLYSFILTFAGVALFLFMRLCHRGSAREPQMRSMAEPLVLTEGDAILPPLREVQSVKAKESDSPSPTQTYLFNLYARAEDKIEHRAIKQYLTSLYERVVA